MGKAYAYDAEGNPFSKWKPSDKFEYIMQRAYPDTWKYCDPEHAFDPERKWRFDFAFPSHRIGIEIDGFGFGHQSVVGLSADNEKQNRAVELGWRVLRFTSSQLGSVDKIRDAADLVVAVLSGATERDE